MEKYRLVGEKTTSTTTSGSHVVVTGGGSGDVAKAGGTTTSAEGALKMGTDERYVVGGDVMQGENETEVRITQQGKPRNYISYAMNLFAQGSNEVMLKAMGRAINKAVTIAEILKRKMPLHQITTLESCEIIDIFEPLEEGLDVVESRRYVSVMSITLSKTCSEEAKEHIGYQPPLPPEEMQPGDLNPSASFTSATATTTAAAAAATAAAVEHEEMHAASHYE